MADLLTSGRDATARRALRDAIDAVPFWWHSIDLGDGIVTPGVKTPAIHDRELAELALPDVRGQTVLDIGTWDGFYALAAERLGARRVVALDHFVWSMTIPDAQRIAAAQLAAHQAAGGRGFPELRLHESASWDPVGLPGRAGFDLAHRALDSAVEPVVLDFAHDDLSALGRFDVVLFLGVLYHLQDPVGALRRLRSVCDGVAVIETEATAIGGHPDAAAAELMGTRKRAGDASNWWAPTWRGLERLCLAAGFSRVTRVGPPLPAPPAGQLAPCRLAVHAWV